MEKRGEISLWLSLPRWGPKPWLPRPASTEEGNLELPVGTKPALAVGEFRTQTQNSGNELENLLAAKGLSKNRPQNEPLFCVEYGLFKPILRWIGTQSGGFPLARE
jgi:hypothetical protein